MGQMGEAEFVEALTAALADREAGVRLSAKQALATIRRGAPAEERWAVEKKAAPVAKAPKAEPPAVDEPIVEAGPAPASRVDLLAVKPFRFRFDGTFGTRA
jgi:HEAT repeat protein